MRPIVVTLVAVLALLAGSVPASGAPPYGLHTTGWILSSGSNGVVDRNAGGLTDISVDGILLRDGGAAVSGTSSAMRRLLHRAHHDGLRAELVLSNYSDRLGDFDRDGLHGLLADPARITAVSRAVAAQVRRQGWDGVNVDLELVRQADGGGLVDLLAALQRRMPAARTVSVDLSPTSTVAGYARSGYRLRGIARHADVIDLMGYDDHGPGWTGPGPVGPLPWQRKVTRAALSVVPAGKIQLGVAGYGYAWTGHGHGYSVSPRRARALVARDGAVARWRAREGEWTATLSDGTVLWWSDARSYALRVALAHRLGLHGTAVWRLGSADPLPRG